MVKVYLVKECKTGEYKTYQSSKEIIIGSDVNVGTGAHTVIAVLDVTILNRPIISVES